MLLTIHQKYANSLSTSFRIAFGIKAVSREGPKRMVKIKTIFFHSPGNWAITISRDI